MKTKNILLTALLALGVAASASAQITVGLNDLVLGFNKTSSTGNTSNLEVTLGSVNNFKAGGSFATGSEVFLSQLNVNDLNTTYGSGSSSAGWKSSVTNWAVVGTNGAGGGNTLWGTQSAAAETPGSSQGSGVTSIQTMYSGLNGQTATANSASAAVVPTANANSWKSTSASSFSYWGVSPFRNDSGIASTGTSVSLELYEFVQGAASAVDLGKFKLYNDGTFSFTAIPEPSTYAALLGVVTLGVVVIRRRRQAALEV